MVGSIKKAFVFSLLSFVAALGVCFTWHVQALAVQDYAADLAVGQAAGTIVQAAGDTGRAAGDTGRTADDSLSTQVTRYNLWIGDKRVTSANASNVFGDGTVKFNAKTQTLTLKNANIKKAHLGKGGSSPIGSGILYTFPSGTFTINVKGKNKVTTPTVSRDGEVAGYTYGISEYEGNRAKLKITGSGSLGVKAGGASVTSCGVYTTQPITVQGSVKLACVGTTSTRVSNGIAPVGSTITIKGSAQVAAYGETGAFYVAPRFSGYTPLVKAGYSAKSIVVNKRKPASSTYTKYPYVKIAKVATNPNTPGKVATNPNTPGKVTITKVTPDSGRFWIYWNKVNGASGYELEVSESSAFPTNATFTMEWRGQVGGTYGYSYIGNLTNGHRYYLRMRAYTNSGSRTYYGAWTATQSVIPRASSGMA